MQPMALRPLIDLTQVIALKSSSKEWYIDTSSHDNKECVATAGEGVELAMECKREYESKSITK